MPFGALLTSLAPQVGGLLQGFMETGEAKQRREDLLGLTNYDPRSFSGLGGSINGQTGQFSADPQTQALFAALQGGGMNLAGGGMFGNEAFQQALGGINLGGEMGMQNALLSQQMGPTAFGQMGGQLGNVLGLANQYGNALSSNTFGQTQASELANMRAAAQPEQNRIMNKIDDRLFSRGMLGTNSTATGEAYRGMQEAFGQQDMNFQTEAFNRALGQRGQQLGAFQGLQGLGLGIEGQGFGQLLSSLQQNQSAGQQRLQNAFGMFDMGQNFLTGGAAGASQMANAALGQQNFGLEGLLGLLGQASNRINATGMHSQAIGQQGDSGAGGLFGGLAEGVLGGIGKIFS